MTILTFTTNGNCPSDNSDMDLRDNTVLLQKFKVDSMLVATVRYKFNEILPSLMAGVQYTAEDLVGAELWADWTPLEQRHAHICLKHLATLPGARLASGSGTNGAATFALVTAATQQMRADADFLGGDSVPTNDPSVDGDTANPL